MAQYPSLYQINTRVWLRDRAITLGRPVTLADIPDEFLGQVASLGFDYVWFLGLWQTGLAGREEPADPVIQDFYRKLLAGLKRPEVQDGRWQLLEVHPAWETNPTWDCFIAFAWEGEGNQRLLITVNYGPTQGQCYVDFPFTDCRGPKVTFQDLMSEVRYAREGDDLLNRGLPLDLPAWGFHLFAW